MILLRVLVAGAAAGVASVFTSWGITGCAFHRFQRRTPDTWRREGLASYAVSSALNVVACVGIALLFALSPGFPSSQPLA